MKREKTKKSKTKNHKKEMVLLVCDWETVDNYSQEEIDDMIDEYHIPEFSMIEQIARPKELTFD